MSRSIKTEPPFPGPSPTLTNTACDARCPATALVMVEKPARPVSDLAAAAAGVPLEKWQAAVADAAVTPATRPLLAFCGHHFHENEALLDLAGFRVVADLRTWKGPNA